MTSTRDRDSERILAGIGLVVVAVACFATLDTAAKISTAAVLSRRAALASSSARRSGR